MSIHVSLALQGLIDPALAGRELLLRHAVERYLGILDGVEIGFFVDQLDQYVAAFAAPGIREALAQFSCNSLHMVSRLGQAADDEMLIRGVALAGELYAQGVIGHASVHLDMASQATRAASLAESSLVLLFENTDSSADVGNTLEECKAALVRYPGRGIVLDYAHALEMEQAGGSGPEHYVRHLGDAVRQIHFSWPGNLYPEHLVGPDFSTRHSMLHLDPANAKDAARRLCGARPSVVTIEGVVPAGPEGEAMVRREAALIHSIFNGRSA